MKAIASRRGLFPQGITLVAVTALGFLVLAGCRNKSGEAGGGFAFPPTPVETAAVIRQTVSERFETVGSIEASEAVTLVAEIPGVVEKLPYSEGALVSQGTVIAQLDDDQLVAERDRAAALCTQAKTTYERVKQVVEEKAAAPQDLDDAAAVLGVAQANLDLAEARLAKTRIKAPFSGIAGVRRVSPGAFLNPGDPVSVIARIEELRIVFHAPERYSARLTKGSPVTITTTAYPGYQLIGQIDAVDPMLDEATRSARVVARVRNPEGKFRPGMSAGVVAVLSQRENALTVPSEAVFMEGNQPFVYVVRPDSTVARQAIKLGTRLPEMVEVLEGLQDGQLTVSAGHQKLFEGAKVMPVSAGAGAPVDTSSGGMP